MPKVLHDLANKLKSEGMEESKAWGTATNILKRQGKIGGKAPPPIKTVKKRGKRGG